ncbi:MAG: hypothetical protein FGM26_00870 [Beijerinckiaceae bacterium]|nr:hypothetical protein [Beijerinckiaceae bacterium]
MRLRHWRMIVFGTAGLVASVIVSLLAFWLLSARYTLTVAAGPAQGYGQRFVSALNEAFKPEEPRIRFNYLGTVDSEASALALQDGRADLAIMRSDVTPPSNGLVIVILRRDAVGLLVPHGSSISGFADLEGKHVALLPGSHLNEQLFNMLLTYSGVEPKKVMRTTIAPSDLTDPIKSKKVDAVFGIGPIGTGPIVTALAAMRRAAPRDKPPVFVAIDDAAGFVKAHPAMETIDVPKGSFGGATSVPDDDATTLALTWRLIAKDTMLDTVAGELARLLILSKNRLGTLMPGAQEIIAPDTDDKSPYLPLHPGAAAYFNDDEESWFDRFEDVFYLVAMLGSVLASIGAGTIGYFRRHKHRATDLADLSNLMQTVATDPNFNPDAAEAELNALVKRGLTLRASHPDDLDDAQTMQLTLNEMRQQIAAQRATLARSTQT